MLSKFGTGEFIVIVLVALFIVGPDRLPKLARSVGKAVASVKHYMNDVTKELRESNADFKEVTDELTQAKRDIADTIKTAGSTVENSVKTKGTDAVVTTTMIEAPHPGTEAPAEKKEEVTEA